MVNVGKYTSPMDPMGNICLFVMNLIIYTTTATQHWFNQNAFLKHISGGRSCPLPPPKEQIMNISCSIRAVDCTGLLGGGFQHSLIFTTVWGKTSQFNFFSNGLTPTSCGTWLLAPWPTVFPESGFIINISFGWRLFFDGIFWWFNCVSHPTVQVKNHIRHLQKKSSIICMIILLMEEILHHLTCANNGIFIISTGDRRSSEPSTVSLFEHVFILIFF